MAEVVTFKVSTAVAAFVKPGVSADNKITAILTAPRLESSDRVTLLFCLMKDADEAVKAAAKLAFAELPDDDVLLYSQSAEGHPSLLNELARVHFTKPAVVAALLSTEQISPQARQFLERQQEILPVHVCHEPSEDDGLPADVLLSADVEPLEGETAEIEEEGEQYLSKYKFAMLMGIGEKIKMALTGDKEWRAILVKDSNKLVSGSVIKNPRITDGEIITLLKVGVQNDEIIRLICANKEWTKNYLIRKALINCPKTPLSHSLRYLATLNEKDIAGYAKSKNISSVLSTQAKRLLLSKKR